MNSLLKPLRLMNCRFIKLLKSYLVVIYNVTLTMYQEIFNNFWLAGILAFVPKASTTSLWCNVLPPPPLFSSSDHRDPPTFRISILLASGRFLATKLTDKIQMTSALQVNEEKPTRFPVIRELFLFIYVSYLFDHCRGELDHPPPPATRRVRIVPYTISRE